MLGADLYKDRGGAPPPLEEGCSDFYKNHRIFIKFLAIFIKITDFYKTRIKEGDAGDDFGEEGGRGGVAEGVQGAAGAAPAPWGRGGGRGLGTAA